MQWLKRLIGVRGTAAAAPTLTAGHTSAPVRPSTIESADAYVAEYLAHFRVNVDYSGDQRDRKLLEKVQARAGEGGSDLVVSVLLKGLELARQHDGSFEELSFIDALAALGDPRAIDPLREVRQTCANGLVRDSASAALSNLHDDNWLEQRRSLETRVRQMIKDKTGVSVDSGSASEETLIKAAALLERDGDFLACQRYDLTFRPILVEEVGARKTGAPLTGAGDA